MNKEFVLFKNETNKNKAGETPTPPQTEKLHWRSCQTTQPLLRAEHSCPLFQVGAHTACEVGAVSSGSLVTHHYTHWQKLANYLG